MDRRILILALATFAVGTSSYAFTGLLADVADALSVTLGTAGQLASVFALTFAVSAPFLASAVSRVDRRRVLVAALALLGGLNLLAAVSPDFTTLLGLRIACGLAATMVTPIAGAAAATMVPAEDRGKALAIVLAGMTIALAFGIPVGTVIGGVFDWRATFTYGGLVCLVAAVAVAVVLPPVPSTERGGLGALAVAFKPAVLTNLIFTALGFIAIFSVVAYMGPIITRVTALTGAAIGSIQIFVGLGAVAGVAVGGVLAGRSTGPALIAVIFVLIAVVALAFSALMWTAPMAGPLGQTGAIMLMSVTVFSSAACLFALSPIVQTRLVDCAPQAAAVVLALNGSMIFLGQGTGAALGGAVTDQAGLAGVGVVGAAAAFLGVATALVAAWRTAPGLPAPGAP